MSRRAPRSLARQALLTTAALLLTAGAGMAGPPWISLEYPANQIDRALRGAIAVVRIYHHENPGQFPVEGTAEGIVDGRRTSIPLAFTPVGAEGAWAVWGDIPEDGTWILAIHGTDGVSKAEISLLAALAPGNREVALVKVPRMREGNWPRAAKDGEIESMLETAVALAAAQDGRSPFRSVTVGQAAMGMGGALLLLPLGLVAVRRRRTDSIG